MDMVSAQNSREIPDEGLEIFVEEFITDREKEIQEVHSFFERADFKQIKKVTHKWIGYSEPYGFATLADLAKELNILLDTEDLVRAKAVLLKIETYIKSKKESFDIG
ncbi:MAG: hypothetical protein M9962_04480 [Oligoflexia bacterium]|nr:hypothetical protein [Oligoflexia bacterium]